MLQGRICVSKVYVHVCMCVCVCEKIDMIIL